MNRCIFCKIREDKTKIFEYESENFMVFPDIHPLKPIHLLVITNEHFEDFLDITDELLIELKKVIGIIVRKKELDKKGYRLVINAGGAQIIRHLHVHIMGPVGKEE